MTVKAEPNVVPLCDVLLVLLIIFIVLTPSLQKGLDVKLPETTQDTSSTPKGLIVLTLQKDGTILINKDAVQLSMLESELRRIYEARQNKTIFIRANATLPYSKVVQVIDIAKGVGVEETGIIPEYFEEDQ